MTLADKQVAFQRDLRKLMDFIESQGMTFTIGEVHRTKDQQALFYQQGKTKSLSSQHLKKLAAKLCISNDVVDVEFSPIWDVETLKSIGDFWEALDPENQWGGYWQYADVTSFLRKG